MEEEIKISEIHECIGNANLDKNAGTKTRKKEWIVILNTRCNDLTKIEALIKASNLPKNGKKIDEFTVISSRIEPKTLLLISYVVTLSSNPSEYDTAKKYSLKPWERPPVVNLTSSEIQVPVYGVTNSAGEEFTNLQKPRYLSGYNVSFAVKSNKTNEQLLESVYAYQGKTNSNAITINRGGINTVIPAEKYFLKTCVTDVQVDTDSETLEEFEFTRITVVFCEMPFGAKREIPDMGYNRRVGGELRPIMIGGIPTNVPQKLSNTMIKFEEYQKVNMANLNKLLNQWM